MPIGSLKDLYFDELGDLYDAGNFRGVLDKLLAAADWTGFPARKEQAGKRGRLRGRGLSVYLEWTGALPT
jgi:carbon-monoxide dehydrogenase large subunit